MTVTAGALNCFLSTISAIVPRVPGFLLARGAPTHHAHGRLRGQAVFDERAGQLANALHAHEHHLGAGQFCELLKVERAFLLAGVLVTRNDRKA